MNADVKEVLQSAKTIAIVGCSPNPYRTSNYIAKFLMERGYTIIPVNPGHDEILGVKCYRSLGEIPAQTKIDVVNIFRDSAHTAGVMDEVLEWNKVSGQNPTVWTQLDVSSPEAEVIAEKNNVPYIKNRCIMVEWEREIQ